METLAPIFSSMLFRDIFNPLVSYDVPADHEASLHDLILQLLMYLIMLLSDLNLQLLMYLSMLLYDLMLQLLMYLSMLLYDLILQLLMYLSMLLYDFILQMLMVTSTNTAARLTTKTRICRHYHTTGCFPLVS